MAKLAYINYIDVVKATNNPKTKSITDFYKNNEFIDIFQKIFQFKKKRDLIRILDNWDENIKEEIEAGFIFKRIINKEIYEIKRLTLREMTTIINIGKYSILKLNLIPEIALAFSLGVYFATFIFEPTSLSLTVEQIYDIIPKNKKNKYNYNNFQKLFIINGTSKEIIDILFSN